MTLEITYPPELPVSERREDIKAAIAANQVTIIAGETGSGKTTQIPKMCVELGLAEQGLIGHTQPRRLAARTVAERIAAELDVELGEEIGYQVRFTGQVGPQTKIKLMTDGILLAEIQHDKLLRRYSTIIIDEAHERSLNIDFILGYLKQILPSRPDLKVIITSATIDPARFAEHFGNDDGPAPIVEVSGRTYPVEVRYRPLNQPPGEVDSDDELEEDRDPLDAVADAVDELSLEAPGDILVFFSGEREIRDAADVLRGRVQSNPRLAGTEILPLFARLSLAEQHRVFSPGKSGKRRIVLATNVAETSLTVPGIKYVIDPGTARISRYSHRTKVQRLPIERVSQASANQRAGRCGRVSNGVCIRLYSEEDFESRRPFTDPEILRTNLAAVILQMNAMGVAGDAKEIAAFPFVEPPDAKAVNDGINLLRELGALGPALGPAGRVPAPGGPAHGGPAHGGPKRGAPARGGTAPAGGSLTPIGRKLAQLPVDPRLGRMIIEAGGRDCAREVMILTAALTIQDPRERPHGDDAGKAQRAAELHKRFVDERSDFTGFLLLWRYIQEKQQELSSTQFRKLCRNEFLNYLRIREWQDLFTQLRQLAKPLGITMTNSREVDPVGKAQNIHSSLLSGLLSHIGLRDERRRDYAGARGTRFAVFPGSALFKKNPEWVMAAELVETSRLWARVVATFDPQWAEQIAPHLIKRSYSEPHWSKKQGSVMAYEKVTLYGVPIVPQRRINYGRIDRELSREMFIRHALVEGDWRTHHKFFHRNRALLEEVDELETRLRRRDIRVDDEALFDFYDERVGAEVVSERHFDKWWKQTRHEHPALLDFDEALLRGESAEELDESAFPKVWHRGGLELPLSYEFSPMVADAADGVTVTIPVLFLNQLSPEPFQWQIPGLRTELVTALIKSLPKAVRKAFVPAPDVARTATAALESNFDPQSDELEPSLELALRRLKGHLIPPGSWNWDAVAPHLKMTFRVVDAAGDVLGEGKDLAGLQQSLAAAVRQAIAESLGSEGSPGLDTGAKRPTRPAKGVGGRVASPASPGGRVASPASLSRPSSPAVAETSGHTGWNFGDIDSRVERTVNGHTITGYPAVVDEGTTVGLRIFPSPAEQESAMRAGVIRLLSLRVPSGSKYVLEHLSNEEKLTFSQNPHGSVASLIEDCTLAAIDKLTPPVRKPNGELSPATEKEFDALYEHVRAELIDTMFAVAAVVERILASARRIERQLKGASSLAMVGGLNDVKSQLERLVYPGFVAKTGYTQLSSVPRYLAAMERRLEKMPAQLQRDGLNMAVVQRLEDEYDDALAARPAGAEPAVELLQVRWMIEELRVSLFAVELGTAYKVSEKRIRSALNASKAETRG